MFSLPASSEFSARLTRPGKIVPALWLLLTVSIAPGCSLFPGGAAGTSALGTMGFGFLSTESSPASTYVPVGGDATLPSSSFNQEAYQAVRKAKQENAIVLQILDTDEPVRVLPLPNAQGSHPNHPGLDVPPSGIFVSTLLTQTGVLQKYGRVQATLFRPSPANFEGVRMDVIFSPNDKRQVRPESDYALRPGDRLVIREDNSMQLDSILNLALGR